LTEKLKNDRTMHNHYIPTAMLIVDLKAMKHGI